MGDAITSFVINWFSFLRIFDRNPSAVVVSSCSHLRRRRNSTRQLSCVGVAGVNWALGTDVINVEVKIKKNVKKRKKRDLNKKRQKRLLHLYGFDGVVHNL